ncbi:hypothetical protein [Thermococcus peptonophilus]|uniref:hypothetical protein n=1 Tax=Thermococcus peptonophilus TaxID=53952 RepID=UPI0034672285
MESAKLEWNGKNITMNKASDTNWYLNVTGLTNGEYTFKVWGKDLSEKWVASEVRTVTVNSTVVLSFVPPTPADGAVIDTDYIFVNVTSSQPLQIAKLEWNGENITMQKASDANWYLNVTGLTNGHYTLRVWGGNDSLGNWFTSEVRAITVNATIHLSFVSPTPDDGAVVSTDYVFINVTSDQPLMTALLEWNGENFTMSNTSSMKWYLNVTNLTNGHYNFKVWGVGTSLGTGLPVRLEQLL